MVLLGDSGAGKTSLLRQAKFSTRDTGAHFCLDAYRRPEGTTTCCYTVYTTRAVELPSTAPFRLRLGIWDTVGAAPESDAAQPCKVDPEQPKCLSSCVGPGKAEGSVRDVPAGPHGGSSKMASVYFKGASAVLCIFDRSRPASRQTAMKWADAARSRVAPGTVVALVAVAGCDAGAEAPDDTRTHLYYPCAGITTASEDSGVSLTAESIFHHVASEIAGGILDRYRGFALQGDESDPYPMKADPKRKPLTDPSQQTRPQEARCRYQP
eukprot:SAG31_NODE_4488_length_3193_cov_5.386555_3_plen_267_part_00